MYHAKLRENIPSIFRVLGIGTVVDSLECECGSRIDIPSEFSQEALAFRISAVR